MSDSVCDNCGSKDAVMKVTQMLSDEMSLIRLCEKCAAEKGLGSVPDQINFPLTDLLAEDAVRRRGLFRPAAVASMVREHLDGVADHGEPLWLLLALEGWMRRVLDPARRLADRAGGAEAGG